MVVLVVRLYIAGCVVCRESCEALTDIFCDNDWGVLSGADGSSILPACETLPSTHAASAFPACFPVDLFAVTLEKISGFCHVRYCHSQRSY